MLRRAPPFDTPVPDRVRASSATTMLFWIDKAAPLATVVPPAAEPRAVAFRMLSVPTETVVAPS